MSSHSNPKWFKPIVIIALLWNLIGVINFFIQINLSEEAIAALPEPEQALMNSTPLWSLVAFALGVFGGAIGSLGLLIQKKLAVKKLNRIRNYLQRFPKFRSYSEKDLLHKFILIKVQKREKLRLNITTTMI